MDAEILVKISRSNMPGCPKSRWSDLLLLKSGGTGYNKKKITDLVSVYTYKGSRLSNTTCICNIDSPKKQIEHILFEYEMLKNESSILRSCGHWPIDKCELVSK